jgi:hypothetical protein
VYAGQTVVAANTLSYFFVPYHRNGASHKSQWSIRYETELRFFESACPAPPTSDIARIWYLPPEVDDSLQVIGVSSLTYRTPRELHIALFINGNPWHGYPADPERHRHDVPPENLVADWMTASRVSKQQGARLLGQRPWL